MVVFDPIDTWKKTKILGGTYESPAFDSGHQGRQNAAYTSPSVMELRDICRREQETLWDESRRFVNPQKVYVDLSQKLYDMKKDLLEKMSEKDFD